MNNDKSTALVSVQDLSAVLQGVKRYIDSSKPNVSWDELYGGERIVHCDTFEKRPGGVGGVITIIPLNTPFVFGADGSIAPELPEKYYIKNLHFERGTYKANGNVDVSVDFLNSSNQYGDGVIEFSGYGEYAAELENGLKVYIGFNPNGVVELDDGSQQLNSLMLAINGYDYNETERLCTFDFIEKSEASPCPPSYVASSIGNESLEEDIKFLKENSGKVTIDGLVKQEFGTLVSGELDGILYQGVLTNIPAQEGVSFKLSNIHYAGDIRYYNASLTEEPEVSRTKEEANQLLHYPRELSGTIQYLEGQFVYGEFSGNLFYALLDLGFDYMVYVDNFGVELTRKPLISYPLKLEVSSLISPDYIDSSLGKANLREDLEKGITWDLIYGIKHNLVTCDELVQLKSGDYWYYGTKVPFDAPFDLSNQPMLKLQNVRAKGIVFGVPEEQLNQMLINFSWNVQSWVNWEEGGVITSLFGSELDGEICIVTQEGLDYGILWWGLHSAEDYTGENAGKLVFDIDSVSQKTHLEHCTGYRSDAGTVIPLSEPFSIGNAPTIRLKDITFLHDYYSDNHRLIYTREQLVQLLGNNKDFVCSVWETGSNLVDGAYMCDIPAEDGSVFMRVLAMTGLPQAYIQMAGDAFVGGRLIDCYVEVGEGYKLCPSEYIASPLGSASLKADVEMLQRKLDKVLQALQYATFTQDVSGILGDL